MSVSLEIDASLIVIREVLYMSSFNLAVFVKVLLFVLQLLRRLSFSTRSLAYRYTVDHLIIALRCEREYGLCTKEV